MKSGRRGRPESETAPAAVHVLVTGRPGIGKTTLIRKVAADLERLRPVGFYTAEIREHGIRKGFALVSLDGRRGLLAHTDIRGPHRVGRYGVDVEALDRFLEAVPWSGRGVGLHVVDEIGRMECASERFRELVGRVLDSSIPLLATIARRGSGLIAEIKRRPDIELLEVTAGNRDAMPGEIVRRFH